MADMAFKGRANPPRGDRHPWRTCPERMPRGDRSGPRKHPEKMKRGVENGNHKLTEESVVLIRTAVRSGKSKNSTAKVFGVTQKCVRMLMRGDTWKHVP